VSEPNPRPGRDGATTDRRIRRSWWVFAGTFALLGSLLVLRLLAEQARPLDWIVAGLVAIAGLAALRHHEAVIALEQGRRAEAESFARIMSGLSRSVSEDAIVGAIVEELAAASGADHLVVALRRPDARALQATLISVRRGVPPSTTLLPISDLSDPVDAPTRARTPVAIPIVAEVEAAVPERAGVRAEARVPVGAGSRWSGFASRVSGIPQRLDRGPARTAAAPTIADLTAQAIADRIADRVRGVYGLGNTLAVPLIARDGMAGAIVLSRRSAEPWPEATRRLLQGAAAEASVAMSRAGSQRTAELHASTDALTGLPNRRYFDEFCALLARRRRAEDAVGVLMIDIDRFKALNDRHGHGAGDEVLRAVGGSIVRAVRDDDVPARYGGEEFVVLLRNPGPAVALEVGERVRAAVAALDLTALRLPSVTVSVGVAVAEYEDEPIGDLVERADRALYRAKRAGRNRVVAA
jgi:diguanylate cyclase (GGDEF)-like protein